MTLDELKIQMSSCTSCSLYSTRTNLVFGVGSDKAELMFVGEAPGFHEDQKGEPFVGAAGKLLDEMLQTIGLTRSQVYIANVLKCRPPNNRNPLPEEIELCKGILYKQIEIIKPNVISTLGNFATKLILNSDVGISKMHGQAVEMENFTVFPIYHPAAALYTPVVKKALAQDFQVLKKLLIRLKKKEDEQQTEANEEDKQPTVEQMALW